MRNLLSYKNFEVVEEFADELNVVLRCTGCGHIFSPGLSSDEMRTVLHGR